MTSYHLAQINIGKIRGPIDGPIMAVFVAGLEPINALADAAPGFVWRLQTDSGNATSIHVYDDDMLLINMSVWQSVEALHEFVYRTEHAAFLKNRLEWFERFEGIYMTMWWIPAGTIPTPREAKERLEHLEQHGPTPYAFTFKTRFPMPETSSAGATQQTI